MIETLYSILNSFYYATLMPVAVLGAIILAIVLFVFVLKVKSKITKTIFCIIVSVLLLFSYHIVPYIFTTKARLADTTQDIVRNYDCAIKTAILPAHKGIIALEYAISILDPQEIKSKYEEAYKYLKKYEPKVAWYMAGWFYLRTGEYEKAMEIFKYNNYYHEISIIYILQNDYETALEYSNKTIERKVYDQILAQRAGIYKKLNKNNLAKEDFNKALALAKNKKRNIKFLKCIYKDPKTCYEQTYRRPF